MNAHLRLVDQWRADETYIAATESPATVRCLESRYDITLPEDFRRYLLESAPQADFWHTPGAIWWSIDRIKNIPDEYEHTVKNPEIAAEQDKYLFFADYMIWCWAWAICCSNGPNRGKVAVITGERDRFVTDCFSDFLEEYLRDVEGICTRV